LVLYWYCISIVLVVY